MVRDIHYDGNAIMERATVITRIAPTFLRFGSLEIFKPTDPFTGGCACPAPVHSTGLACTGLPAYRPTGTSCDA